MKNELFEYKLFEIVPLNNALCGHIVFDAG